jgi:hypothetical protein
MKLYTLAKARKILNISQRRLKRLTEGRRSHNGHVDSHTLKYVRTKLKCARLIEKIRQISKTMKAAA